MRKIEVRCLNCFERVEVPPKAKRVTCPNCKVEYHIGWVTPEQAKILAEA